MENEQLERDENEMKLDDYALEYLEETAKWTKFLSIVGFVGIGFSALVCLVFLFIQPLAALYLIVFVVIGAFPLYYLYNFATKTKDALQTRNSFVLSDALQNLKSHFKFNAIFLIVILSLYALLFLFVIMAGSLNTLYS